MVLFVIGITFAVVAAASSYWTAAAIGLVLAATGLALDFGG